MERTAIAHSCRRGGGGSLPREPGRVYAGYAPILSIVDLGAQCEGRVRLGWINRAVNMTVRPVSDWVQYGYGDFWASPLQTLGSGAGDCQDYAIVKYVALRGLRIPADDLRLIVVQDEKRETGHAAVAVSLRATLANPGQSNNGHP
ncbi:MAG: transglutaminase-like cysteine peptidase [Pseudolabrys sp.]